MTEHSDSSCNVYGIRHHGPGSARSLLQALEADPPDCLLLEGPPDASDVLHLAGKAEMKPPVALLVYVTANPQQAVYYPFAEFSPEWQAIRFGLKRGIPVRFMDLPQTHRLAMYPYEAGENSPPDDPPEPSPVNDPLDLLAAAAGFNDGERWWEYIVEHRRESSGIFTGIGEAMRALRDSEAGAHFTLQRGQIDGLREAHMRQTIRTARSEGFSRIAVVCGAWHAPVLPGPVRCKEDAEMLKKLPKVKVSSTWIPWTLDRLSLSSGYGAGIESPGWYGHLWKTGRTRSSLENRSRTVTIRWMTKVAKLLREADLDASTASVIEAVRLAEALAALRHRPLPGLEEMTEATQTIFCFGNPTPLKLISKRLIIGEKLGEVPSETPLVPLQQNLTSEQKRLKLTPAGVKDLLQLDLRKPLDLGRSCLLHRLNLLGINWGSVSQTGNQTGTFHEHWRMNWKPEFAVRVIEMAAWGNTLVEAAGNFVQQTARQTKLLAELTELLDRLLLADLPTAVAFVLGRIQDEAALTGDTVHLMEALPPLAKVLRYGNVRQTDLRAVGQMVDTILTRICISLPLACASLDNAAAGEMAARLTKVHQAVGLLNLEEKTVEWNAVLLQLAEQSTGHGLISGRAIRFLLDGKALEPTDVSRRMGLALAPANPPASCAAWVEGFLQGSGLLLLHDLTLWEVLDRWVCGLSEEQFISVLPLVVRTFSKFPAPERRNMGELVKRGQSQAVPLGGSGSGREQHQSFDPERAAEMLPLLRQLLGLEIQPV
ncbi:MAG: hypothetical protein K1Y36_05325 [Blastocatellia bacterium]|nr:hypothetical protein [Blastocatellia bacterium]